MIPVELQPEPPDFDRNVRQRGQTWLADNGVGPDASPPNPAALPNYWSHSNKQLWEAYSGVCAYLAIHFEWCTGAFGTRLGGRTCCEKGARARRPGPAARRRKRVVATGRSCT